MLVVTNIDLSTQCIVKRNNQMVSWTRSKWPFRVCAGVEYKGTSCIIKLDYFAKSKEQVYILCALTHPRY